MTSCRERPISLIFFKNICTCSAAKMCIRDSDIPEAISMSDRIIVLSARPSVVKAVHQVEFDQPDLPPLQRRNNPAFSRYFNLIWKELNQ